MTNFYDHAYQFLKIETPRGLIKGESRDARHVNEIDVYGFSWGMTPTMIKQLRITKGVDSASTPLAWLLHNQALIKKGVLSLCKAGENLPAYFRLVFEEARVTSLSMRVNDKPGPMLLEEVTLSFVIYRAEYIRPSEEAISKVFLDTPKPVMVAGWAGVGKALKGVLQDATKAERVDKTPDVPSKPPEVPTLSKAKTAANLNRSHEISQCGEKLARIDMRQEGFDEVIAVQNKSGHGVDLVGHKYASGEMLMWEVKTTTTERAPRLSKEQARLGGKKYTNDRLERAAGGAGNYGKVPEAKRNAIKVKDWLKDAELRKAPISYKKREVFVDDIDKGCMKHPTRKSVSKPWEARQ